MEGMAKTLHIDYDETLLKALKLSEAEFDREAKFLLAAKLYELGRVSSGKAAAFCGMGRVEFLLSLSRIGVNASNLEEDALDEESPLVDG
jgi:predicted HTH domain antitoxin